MRRILTLLRSPRLAVWLFGVLAGYSFIGTLVPQTSQGSEVVAQWAASHAVLAAVTRLVGLHDAFVSPLFIVPAALLGLSTTVCAWDRTSASLKAWRYTRPSDPFVERLRTRAPIVVDVGRGPGVDAATRVLRRNRLRTTQDGDLVVGRSGWWALAGSPVFHWSLALLILVIALGQLTRSEGQMDIVSGSSKPDAEASYGLLERGPLHGSLSGRTIAVPSIPREYKPAGGVEQGPTPVVELRSPEGILLASGHVYPNNPLRHGATTIHGLGYGLAVVARVSRGQESFSDEVLLQFDEASPTGVRPVALSLTAPDGGLLAEVRIDLPPEQERPEEPAILVSVTPAGGGGAGVETSEAVLMQGQSLEMTQGIVFTPDRLTRYARLAVVDDWSVPVMYALFGTALIGLSVAVLLPSRKVWVLVVSGPHGVRLHAAATHARRDPGFGDRIEAGLRATADREQA